ncbi:hypothetical protein PPSIR1_31768 [Plesiocystis pacifica SIR-1]|uniref:Uncharacterized protein n=1 Tax=Plesiocystis pacifica SIR-1 TaxID=391625 RepID=A6G2S1_9BACT|nr:hypothetical protein [Plesiocystis pacifica]EDM79771.1 hypothetical protein PPSIR1_31768 [Plesiocystis pacifica SIR-1]
MAIRDPERFFDNRTVRRHIKRGHVSEADYDSFVQTLPDASENIKDKEEGGDDDGYEARAANPEGAEQGAEGQPGAAAPAPGQPAQPGAAAPAPGQPAVPGQPGDPDQPGDPGQPAGGPGQPLG